MVSIKTAILPQFLETVIGRAKAGRNSYIAEEQLIGSNDPGAEAVALLIEHLASELKNIKGLDIGLEIFSTIAEQDVVVLFLINGEKG